MNTSVSDNERIKVQSRNLRGTISAGLVDAATGAVSADDAQLLKFHGIYQQDDRDLRIERLAQKLEPLYSFMLRARLPGGVISSEQWLAIDQIAVQHTHYGSIRLTTRQTFQYHGIFKSKLRRVVRALNTIGVDSRAACGDVNRNVLCSTNISDETLHGELVEWARRLSGHLLPRGRAYFDVWLDDNPIAATPEETEPLYGASYLPRKFKMALACPPYNDVDVLANDIGLIAITNRTTVRGFNVLVGGGMGITPQDERTYPRLATPIGYVEAAQLLPVVEAIVTIQRDWGERAERRQARLKYTLDRRGLAVFCNEVSARSGVALRRAKDVQFTHNCDHFGWSAGLPEHHHLTLCVPGGRVHDTPEMSWRSGLRAIAEQHDGGFRLTANQNVMVANIQASNRDHIAAIAREHGLIRDDTSVRQNAVACVALPTCGLAMAESERYLPHFVERLESLLGSYGLDDAVINLRLSGCPNGCSRPYLAEIALVGQAPGKYNLYLGGSRSGDRLAVLYQQHADEETLFDTLAQLFAAYARDRETAEGFGDYLWRANLLRQQWPQNP